MIKHDLDNFEFSYLSEEGIKAGNYVIVILKIM
ncbi:acetyltransferase [Actinobacillus equuli]|nr:acetyltransferase [Actinobacillus equuli]